MRQNCQDLEREATRVTRAVLSLLPLLALAAAPPTYHYRIDAPHSEVAARVGLFGIASKTARFPAMTGTIALSPDRLDTIDLDVKLDARHLTAGDSVTLARLKGPNFFDVARYPMVRFTGRRMTMTGPVTATVDGAITARGVTRPIVLAVSFAQSPARATGRDPIALTARATIDRRDFGMNAYRLIVGSKVTITINARMVPV